MEPWVGAVAKDVRLVPVQHIVVNVTHLVVCRDKPILRDLRALSNPESKIIIIFSMYKITPKIWIQFSKVEKQQKVVSRKITTVTTERVALSLSRNAREGQKREGQNWTKRE